MDSSSFDRLTRFVAVTHSRRMLGGVVLSAVAGLLSRERVAAAPCPKGQKRCRQRCIPRRQCCTRAHCRPKPTGRICRRGRCVCPPGKQRCRKRCIPKRACCPTACPGHGQPNTVTACVGQQCRLTRQLATPGAHFFTAPGVGTLTADVFGACGGAGGRGEDGSGAGGAGGAGGLGGHGRARFPVVAGELLLVLVGGVGGPGAAGAAGGTGGAGGGNGADPGETSPNAALARGGGGGGGGGTTELRRAPFTSITLLGGGGGGGGGGAGNPSTTGVGTGGDGGDGGGPFAGTGGDGGETSGEAGAPGSGGAAADASLDERELEPGVNNGPGWVTLTWDEA